MYPDLYWHNYTCEELLRAVDTVFPMGVKKVLREKPDEAW